MNQRICRHLTSQESFRWRLERLHEEHGVYFQRTEPGDNSDLVTSVDMRNLFLKNVPLRHMWKKAGDILDTGFQTTISVRFKPITDEEVQRSKENSQKRVLPLNQQLALLRLSHHLPSNRAAVKLLWNMQHQKANTNPEDSRPGEGGTFISEHSSDSTHLQKNAVIKTGIQKVDHQNNRVIVMDPSSGLKEVPFDNVLPVNVSQEVCYRKIGHPSIRDVLCGYNATVFMYGQTGSGKTHTMTGTSENPGMLPRALQELFHAVEDRRKNSHNPIQSEVSVSYIEVFGGAITDLLRRSQKVAKNMAAAHRFVLEGYASYPMESLEQCMAVLAEGEQQKRIEATAMNERSTRAHSLFIVTLTQTCRSTTRTSRLILGDLGGAEQLKKSQSTNSSGGSKNTDWKARTQEAIYINMALLALKKCVHALNQGDSYVPYRDSQLTRLLSSGLGQNARTQIVVCASQNPEHAKESIASLQFAQACSKIESSDRPSVRSTDQLLKDMLDDLDERINNCRKNIRLEERWETEHQERPDGEGGIEIRSVSRMVGAEHLNEELEELLRRRADLTGTAWTEE